MKPPTKVARPKGTRKHVTLEEYKKIRAAAGELGRHKLRDTTMITMAFIHGLRATEVVHLLWDQVNLHELTLFVTRAKKGSEGTHPLSRDEVTALRRLAKSGDKSQKGYVFMTERGGPLTTSAFSKMLARAGKAAGMPMRIGTHMLRHGCGFYFANKGKDTRSLQGYLGHRNIQNTVIYTELRTDRFKGFEVE
jgi:type 1 fimbriae regulatory protein FimB/type 1 fimbriae regulatory protein FimE